jgi:hypothetical protein
VTPKLLTFDAVNERYAKFDVAQWMGQDIPQHLMTKEGLENTPAMTGTRGMA